MISLKDVMIEMKMKILNYTKKKLFNQIQLNTKVARIDSLLFLSTTRAAHKHVHGLKHSWRNVTAFLHSFFQLFSKTG